MIFLHDCSRLKLMDSPHSSAEANETVRSKSRGSTALSGEHAELSAPSARVIGVFPRTAVNARLRLFRALERVLPVRFEGREPGDFAGLDAVVTLSHECSGLGKIERLGVPCLAFHASREATSGRGDNVVELASFSPMDSRLRGRRFTDLDVAGQATLEHRSGDLLLAATSAGPIWALRSEQGANLYLSSVPLARLEDGESIRDYLRCHRFCSLLPLVHLARDITSGTGWTAPPLRATFIIDDPNLHWPSYGYVRFGDLARHSRAHGYHIAMATIPLDLWYFDRRAVRIFRDNPAALSLVIHGNDHVRNELARPRSKDDALQLLSQALSRVAKFERRSGLRVARVIVPPHGDCSDLMFDALATAGFAAIAWSPIPRSEISGWDVAEFSAGGLPSLPRPLLTDWDDLPFRAYLDQPIVSEGHHTDLRDGLDVLERTVSQVNGLETCPGDRPRRSHRRTSRFASSATDSTFVSSRAAFGSSFPRRSSESSSRLLHTPRRKKTWLPSALSGPNQEIVSCGLLEDASVAPGEVEIRLTRALPADLREARSSLSLWPCARRILTEGRDRTLPLADALRGRRRG